MNNSGNFGSKATRSAIHGLRALPFCLLGNLACAAIIHVPGDHPGIQAAINAAQSGDTVLVAAGEYHGNLVVASKNIVLQSAMGPEATVLDGDFAGSVLRITGVGRSMKVDGFTIRNGLSSNGGGISLSGAAPTIINNVIAGNRGASGNGIQVQFSAPLIQNNIIENNTNMPGVSGGGGGGGIYVGGDGCMEGVCTEIVGNLIEGNTTPNFLSGGGILLFASGPVRILRNTIRGNSTPGEGGGIAAFNGSDALIESNVIEGNAVTGSGGEGGGVYWLVPSGRRGPFLVNNTIINNSAVAGSAVYADGFDISSRIANNIILGNSAAALIHCGNFNDPNAPIIRYNMLHNSLGAIGNGLCPNLVGASANISAVPEFEAFSFALTSTSAGIDAGLNSDVTEATDFRGGARILNGRDPADAVVDLGAYEYDDSLFRDGLELP